MESPTPEQIRDAREAAGLTHEQCAAIVDYSVGAWRKWEYGERKMRRKLFDDFLKEIQKST